MRHGNSPVHAAHVDSDVSKLLADAARSFFAPDSVEDTLSKVTASAMAMIDSVDCADILIVSGKRFRSHAATSDLPVRLDSLQEQLGEGPCVDAARREMVVRSRNLSTDERWPRFGPAAAEAGIASTLSFKLYTGDDNSIGALNLFARTVDAFDDGDEEVGTMLATHAAMALYTANKAEQFASALASRDLIGQAKGMIMERYDIDSVRAFELLSKLSQDTNVSVSALAADLVRLGSQPPSDS